MIRIFSSLLIAVFISFTCLAQQTTLEEKQDEAFQFIFTNKEKAIVVIDSLIDVYKNNTDFKQGKNFSNKGVYYAVQNQLDSAVVYFNKAIVLTPKAHEFYPKLLSNLSIVNKKKGNYREALKHLLKGLEVAKTQHNIDGESLIYSELSSVYRSLNEYNLAVEYSLKTLDIIQSQDTVNNYYLFTEKQKLANLYRALDKNAFAIDLYQEILPYFENSIYTDAKISTYINYAAALMNINEFNKAKVFLDKAQNEVLNFENDELFAFYKLIYAKYYIKIDEPDKADKCFRVALSKFTKLRDNYPKTLIDYLKFLNDQDEFQKIIDYTTTARNLDSMQVGFQDLVDYHRILGLTNERLGYYQKSLYHYKIKIEYADSLNEHNNFAIAKNLQAKYQNEILTQRNAILQQKNTIQIRTNLLIIIGSILLIIIFFVLLIRYNYRIEVAKKLQHLSNEKISAEEELNEFKDNLLKEQKKELLSRSFEINKLNKDLQFIRKSINSDNNSLAQRLNDVDHFISPKHEIQKLQYEFDRVYPNFYQNLKSKYPKLNKNDSQFLCLVKMKFSYKEIADIINITHKSVITKKYRIAKKMAISNNDNFYDFIEKNV